MKLLFLAFVFILLTVHAKAQTLKGSVKNFQGYVALETSDGERLLLPQWIDSHKLVKDKDHELLIEGSIRYIACPGEPETCPTGEIKKVRWMQYQNTSTDSRNLVYTGLLKRFSGAAVETRFLYDYVALEAGRNKIALPGFLDADLLVKFQPQVTIIGDARPVLCFDMSDACGPDKLDSYTLIKLDF
ncbi:MAG: hypothetical protein H0V66_14140 [Bdellovibrionales bacterium]|nr:hypothetical protein [Bdellovibrionales bacterium]